MNYPLRCECGKQHRVAGTLAGSFISCDCGRQLKVPSLSRLKSHVGESALSPEVRLDQMLQLGMLPVETRCGCCGKETPNVVHFWVVCEQIEVYDAARMNWFATILIALSFDFVSLLEHDDRERGSDIRLRLPLRVCDGCAPQLKEQAILEKAVWSIPVYGDLREKYPRAELSLEAELRPVILSPPRSKAR
jgi:hypothetical protein